MMDLIAQMAAWLRSRVRLLPDRDQGSSRLVMNGLVRYEWSSPSPSTGRRRPHQSEILIGPITDPLLINPARSEQRGDYRIAS